MKRLPALLVSYHHRKCAYQETQDDGMAEAEISVRI